MKTKKAVPQKIQADPIQLRLDFHHESVMMTEFLDGGHKVRMVSALDVAHALASELSFSSGLLPQNTLWWSNTSSGPVIALYEPPRIRKIALQVQAFKEPKRFTVPLPGLIFLCRPGLPPSIFAVKSRPTKSSDKVFKAPLCNIFEDGRSCPGNHKYPSRVEDIIESFFISFFSSTGDLQDRSKRFPKSVVELWESLDKEKEFPLEDMVQHGTVKDLMEFTK
ncbi:MAG: hypothetical protein JW901_05340 [Dehalococcoidia bacterium]|nr:hypothetical protein [Dehalococcoidia bacterium]